LSASLSSYVPNTLSLLRLLLSPLVPLLVLRDKHPFALLLIALLALTDFLDGFLARKLRASTPLGKLLDPLADKAFTFFSLLSYTFISDISLSPSLFFSLLFRDVFLIVGGYALKKRGITPEPSLLGKLTTLTVSLALITVALANALNLYTLRPLIFLFETLGTAFAVISFFHYAWKGTREYLKINRVK